MTDELTWQEKRDAGIKASKLKKQEQEKFSRLESEVESLRREVMALKKAHNNLLTLLEKDSRSSTTYTSFFVAEF